MELKKETRPETTSVPRRKLLSCKTRGRILQPNHICIPIVSTVVDGESYVR